MPKTLYEDILEDISDRQKWSTVDEEICRRRLSERKKKKKRPYAGAPNGVIPIIDDVTNEKTDQEITMLWNAPLLAHFIPLSETPPDLVQKAAVAFDTYLRHICEIRPKLEESVDTKNARGFSNLVIKRRTDDRWGELVDTEAVDPRDIIVPANTKSIKTAERICHVLRLNPRELRDNGRYNNWKNVEAVIDKAKQRGEGTTAREHNEKSIIEATEHLVGITTSGNNTDMIVVWQVWCYATKEDAAKDDTKELQVGGKCCKIFSPDATDLLLRIYAWKEDDQRVQMDEVEMAAETVAAAMEGRAPLYTKTVKGKDKPWPYIQPRAESRSSYYYDSRGVGHKCMDDQIYATGLFNAKMTLIDYISQPMFQNDGGDNSSNFTGEPGAIMPKGLSFAALPQVPPHLDFSVDMHKRVASQRMGSVNSIYSAQVASTRKLQKTATEVESEENRVATVSSASVDRFNDPWRELFMQIFEDLKRIKKPLPMIQNGAFIGMAPIEIYDTPFLIVPAASSKTLNPDVQFARAKDALMFVMQFAQFVPVNFQTSLDYVLSHYDPRFKDYTLIDPAKAGPQGQPPMYQTLQNIQAAVESVAEITDRNTTELNDLQKFSVGMDDKIKKIKGETNAQEAQAIGV